MAIWQDLVDDAPGAALGMGGRGDAPSRRRPSLPADPWEPALTYVSPSPSRPAQALAGPACRALESGHSGLG